MRRAIRILLALFLLWQAAPAAVYSQQVITTSAGGGPDRLPAVSANLPYPDTVMAAPSGDLFVSSAQGRIYRIDPQGQIHLAAGNGGSCFFVPYGDGLPARDACFVNPVGLALDASGSLYIADGAHHAVRRVDGATGLVSRYAGDYSAGTGGDGGPAATADLDTPYGIALDRSGNLYIVERGNHRVRRVDAVTRVITTVAGTGKATGSIDGPGGDDRDDFGEGLTATHASLKSPYGIAVDAAGNLYIGDTGNLRVRRVDAATQVITTVAGDGSFDSSGDGVPATATGLAGPAHVWLDPAGNLYIADTNDVIPLSAELATLNHRVRRVAAATGIITIVAGSENGGFGGDGGPAVAATMDRPTGVAVDAMGNVLIADQRNHRLRKVAASTGVITTLGGNGTLSYSGDGFAATSAAMAVSDIAFDGSGNLYVADGSNGRVRRVDILTRIITTVAGNGSFATSGDGGPAVAAGLMTPAGMALDAAGNLFIVDIEAGRVRRVDHTTGIITTVAGNGIGYGGDGGNALNALFNFPTDAAVAANGDLYIVDSENHRIRRVRNSVITTVAGNGVETGSVDGPGGDPSDDLGDGGDARLASLSFPSSIAFDPAGDLVISDSGNERVRRLRLGNLIIDTIAGDGVSRFAGDGGPANAASLRAPWGVAYDAAGNLYIGDSFNDRVRRVDALSGIITSVAGDGTRVWGPNGRLATATSLYGPGDIAIDPADRLHVTTSRYARVRVIYPTAPPAGELTDGTDPAVKPLDVTRLANGNLTLSWGASCSLSDNDFIVYEGTLGDWASHAPILCSTGGATAATLTPAAGDRYYLVVPRHALREGSFGARSDGTPRPEGSGSCLARLTGGTCP